MTFLPTLFPTPFPFVETAPPTETTITEVPTKRPTDPPQPAPTDPPQPAPTDPPQPAPTDPPEPAPTDPPEPAPTDAPRPAPTDAPVPAPTDAPEPSPTDAPVPAPTDAPVPEPTDAPTSAPARDPTERPERPPQAAAPAIAPIGKLIPTPTETDVRNESPTPSDPPTFGPTVHSSGSPSVSLYTPPTLQLSLVPGASPAPTAAPSDSFEFQLVSLRENGLRMVLQNSAGRALQASGSSASDCTILWRKFVRDQIQQEVEFVVPEVETLDVDVANVKTESEKSVTSLLFDVLIQIRSPIEEHDIFRYIEGPFDEQSEKQEFIDVLRSSDCPEFANVESVDLVVTKSQEDTSPSEKASDVGLIAGLALAITGLLLLLATFIYVRRRNKRRVEEYPEMASYPSAERDSTGGYASEVDLELNEKYEVSTLGDPIPESVLPMRNGGDASTTGTQSIDYDFDKAFVDQKSITESHVAESTDNPYNTNSHLGSLGFDAEGSNLDPKEQEFEVVAPAGLLGLILESDIDDGRPTVHNVKPNSVLCNVVKVGDRLLSVDNVDVTKMRASDVSQLIASKRDQKGRILTFGRYKNANNETIDIVSVFE